MTDTGPWITKTILELEERVAELTEEIEHLQDSLIRQGKMLSAIVNITKGPPDENTLHSTHDAVESVERLQALVAELYDLIKYAQVDSGVCMCGDDIKDHNQSSGHMPLGIWDHAADQIHALVGESMEDDQ